MQFIKNLIIHTTTRRIKRKKINTKDMSNFRKAMSEYLVWNIFQTNFSINGAWHVGDDQPVILLREA